MLDVRYEMGGPPGHAEFVRGHVPGARFVDLEVDLADPPAEPPGPGGRHPLPDPERFARAMRRGRVSSGRPVVVYDDWQGRAAARAWWLLRHHGHRDVRVLDGGWAAWQAAGAPVEAGETERDADEGDFTVSGGPGMPVVHADDVLGVGVLVDARAPERFLGDTEPIDPVAGHVPGAVNVPTTTNLDQHGRFRDGEVLRALYAAAGVTGERDVAVYCGSGVTACHDILALAAAGVPAALYPGSWSEWVSDPGRPVETH